MALTAIYGGAFDPVHEGHLAVARCARDVLDADIALVPTGDPRHRAPAHASAAQRLAMLECAIRDVPRLRLDSREVRRAGPSFSVDTLTELRTELGPQAPLAMIVGDDAFAGLPAWHRWQDVFELAHIVIASRAQSVAWPSVLAAQVSGRECAASEYLHQRAAGQVFRLAVGDWPQSSSLVRARCAAGLPLTGWVPPAVAQYIGRHHLYRSAM